MYEYAENRHKALELARQCLSAAAGAMESLYLYNFEDDAEAHDDSLQERVAAEFDEVWLGVVAELTKTFGPAYTVETEEDAEWVPLCGVGGAAWWETEHGRLWVAYAHEDRETPFLLMVGKA